MNICNDENDELNFPVKNRKKFSFCRNFLKKNCGITFGDFKGIFLFLILFNSFGTENF